MVFKIETDFWINFNRFYNFKSNDIVILGIVTKFLYWLCFTPDLQSLLKVIFLSRDFQFFQYSCLCITDFENALQFISLRRCLLCLDFSKFWDYKYYFIIISIIFISVLYLFQILIIVNLVSSGPAWSASRKLYVESSLSGLWTAKPFWSNEIDSVNSVLESLDCWACLFWAGK